MFNNLNVYLNDILFDKFLIQALSKYYEKNYHDFFINIIFLVLYIPRIKQSKK
jgi:hypothetical protein